MGVDYSTLILLANYDFWARDVTIIPIVSQPGAPAYINRGIYDCFATEVPAEDGTLVSDYRSVLDVREIEYGAVPVQGDQIDIPADVGAMGQIGLMEITDAFTNGGGETTLVMRKVTAATPVPTPLRTPPRTKQVWYMDDDQ